MILKDKNAILILEKHNSFFNTSKYYFWLIDEFELGNLERAIIRMFQKELIKIKKQTSDEEFKVISIKLTSIHVEVLSQKNSKTKNKYRPECVLEVFER